MITDNAINKLVADKVLEEEAEEKAKHVSSGKLSASGLNDPLQWQILKTLGVPTKEMDEYTLRKFQRGKDVEDRILGWLPVSSRQEFVEYRNVVGYLDATINSSFWFTEGLPKSEMPLEIKSVTNAKFKRIVDQGSPDKGHILQVCLYGLAKGTKNTAIGYVASDDYRIQSYILNVEDYKKEIDDIIDKFNDQIAKHQIPVFEAREKWMADLKYCKYPDFMEKNQEELDEILLELNK